MQRLEKKDRMRLMRFVCSFAWADLEVQNEERVFVGKLVKQLDLDEEEAEEVEQMLNRPPKPEEVDPAMIPRQHREVFLDAVYAVIASDGCIAPEEHENYRLLQDLLK